MKRKVALDLIMWDYAKNGKDTGEATREKIEAKISFDIYKQKAKEGLEIFNNHNH